MRYIIVGNGVSGTTAAANIRKLDNDGEITIITDEAYPFYSRIRLIEFLAGETDEKGLLIRKDKWYEENRLGLVLGTQVAGIENEKKMVTLSNGEGMPYDRLLLATGGVPHLPPIPGAGLRGAFALRTLRDAIAIREYAAGGKGVVVLGGGVLGLEAGNALRKAGSKVTVIEFLPRLLPRQMDTEGAALLKAKMEGMGIGFHIGKNLKEITGAGKVSGVVLEDGTKIDCGLVLLCCGVRPNAGLAGKLGLPVKKGIPVNDRMETAIKDIYAAGDLIEHRGVFYGIWPAAEKQGEVAGINMAGGTALYEGTVISNTLKVVGIDLFAAGDIDPEGRRESIVFKDDDRHIYKKLVIGENRLVGAILLGDLKDRARLLKAIETKKDISGMRDRLRQWDVAPLS